ncbi:hypothetical protein [Streptomyces sp.]|uniref:hypothetical protein n=1 Tax=Streptomyces sp. TaxID=1931 RepID=UPI002F942B38
MRSLAGNALRRAAERAGTSGGKAAARAMGEEGQREMRRQLGIRSHAPGAPTNSPPGQPPARVSGDLQRSVIVDRPRLVGPFKWRSRVGPTVVYARIQDLGGIAGNGAVLPPRPYTVPTVAALRAKGILSEKSGRAFHREVWG